VNARLGYERTSTAAAALRFNFRVEFGIQAYGEYLRQRTAQQIEDDRTLIEASNDIALRDSQW
jgi:hypothetical protein